MVGCAKTIETPKKIRYASRQGQKRTERYPLIIEWWCWAQKWNDEHLAAYWRLHSSGIYKMQWSSVHTMDLDRHIYLVEPLGLGIKNDPCIRQPKYDTIVSPVLGLFCISHMMKPEAEYNLVLHETPHEPQTSLWATYLLAMNLYDSMVKVSIEVGNLMAQLPLSWATLDRHAHWSVETWWASRPSCLYNSIVKSVVELHEVGGRGYWLCTTQWPSWLLSFYSSLHRWLGPWACTAQWPSRSEPVLVGHWVSQTRWTRFEFGQPSDQTTSSAIEL
jgi:hypothetical protein